jgi:hypothetical protein
LSGIASGGAIQYSREMLYVTGAILPIDGGMAVRRGMNLFRDQR